MRAPLYLNHDADYGWLIAMPFGEVSDEVLGDEIPVSDRFRYASRPEDGAIVGFVARSFGTFDPEDPDVARIWREPLFDVPALGLRSVSAGGICLAAKTFLRGRSTINRTFFDNAVNAADRIEALVWWTLCLEAGDCMAHYGLGYTLLELCRPHEAYRELRSYVEIVPLNAWAWCYFGKAAQEIGELDEAVAAYRRAIDLEAEGGEVTDALHFLNRLS